MGTLCIGCKKAEETNSHVTECEKFADLRKKWDMSSNYGLVNFFREVMARREDI